MTDPKPVIGGPDVPPDPPEPDPPTGAPADDDGPDLRSREAANYRAQLRTAQAELAQARTLLDGARSQIIRAELARLSLGGQIVRSDAADAVFEQLDRGALFDDAGVLDRERLEAAGRALLETAPYYFGLDTSRRLENPTIGTPPPVGAGRSWADAFGPRR